jgi:hypothetical protein
MLDRDYIQVCRIWVCYDLHRNGTGHFFFFAAAVPLFILELFDL